MEEAESHRRLNKHIMSILAAEGTAGPVHCVNESLEAHWLHSSLVYFKEKDEQHSGELLPSPLPTSREVHTVSVHIKSLH